jgi:hypothetical protein
MKLEQRKTIRNDILAICDRANSILLTGSKYICPSVENKDVDIMLLVDDIADFADKNHLIDDSGKMYPWTLMKSYRIDEYNILLTGNEEYFGKWKFATELAIGLNLTKKEDRKFLFSSILNNEKLSIDPSLDIVQGFTGRLAEIYGN